MCQQLKYVFNKYICKTVLVPCGKCIECQQSKANLRSLKIRNHNQSSHDLCIFVTLTYSNKYVPYVVSSDLECSTIIREIPIWRDYDIKFYSGKPCVSSKKQVGSIFSSDLLIDCHYRPWLKRKDNCTGVIFWPDVQRFIKRLRINLLRNKYNEKISYFAVGEYGSTTYRPHFHLLIYFPNGSIETLRPIIATSWPYGDMSRANKRIQTAIDASSYLASYLAKSANLPKILTSPAIRQKHSHSFHFGTHVQCFSLLALLSHQCPETFSYSRSVLKDGVPSNVDLPIPKYVINRFFPKFKGYSAFAPDEILQLLRFPRFYWNKLGYDYPRIIIRSESSSIVIEYNRTNLLPLENAVTSDDYHKFVVRLLHAYDYYHLVTGKNIYDFAIDYQRMWLYSSLYTLRHQYDDVEDFSDFYENISDFIHHPKRYSLSLDSDIDYVLDYNKRSYLKRNAVLLRQQYYRKLQTRLVNSAVLSAECDEF